MINLLYLSFIILPAGFLMASNILIPTLKHYTVYHLCAF